MIKPSNWLDNHSPVHQMIWAPGLPQFIEGKVLDSGGWIEKPGVRAFNLYKPPKPHNGRTDGAKTWTDHVHSMYPEEAEHLIQWLAHRVQHPQEKINHAIIMGGGQGIGKDTILEPVKFAVGAWNFKDISPVQMIGRFNGFVKSAVLRINEGRDMGDLNRYAFYEHMKVYAAAPPDVIRCDEKNIREYDVLNCCGVIITTNHKTGGIYLPEDDRRHFVCWSDRTRDEFNEEYWTRFYSWYERGGLADVAAYLANLDLSKFNPKAPPAKTEAWYAIVNSERPTEAGELSDVMESLEKRANGEQRAYTLTDILAEAVLRNLNGLVEFLEDRKNRRLILSRLNDAGYDAIRNPDAKDGRWRVPCPDERTTKQAVYAKIRIPKQTRFEMARARCGHSGHDGRENLSRSDHFPGQSRDSTKCEEKNRVEQDGKSRPSRPARPNDFDDEVVL